MEYTRVAAMTPMFSAYVVVGEPPTLLAIAVAKPSPASARPMYGSRSSPVISATALTWPAFSAINAMTPGRTRMMNVRLNDGAWMPTIPLASSENGGRPNHDADCTESQLTRKCSVI